MMQENLLSAIECPHCRERSIDSSAKIMSVRGYVVWYTRSSRIVFGCSGCVRRALLREGGRSLLLGWFSVKAFLFNLVFVPLNLGQALILKPNPVRVLERMREEGMNPDALLSVLAAGYTIAADLVVAGGGKGSASWNVAIAQGPLILLGFDDGDFAAVYERTDRMSSFEAAQAASSAVSVADRDRIFSYAYLITAADGDLDATESELLSDVARGLGINVRGWQRRNLGGEPR